MEALDSLVDQGKLSINDYSKKHDQIWKEELYKEHPGAYIIQGNGREYIGDYVQTIGKDITIAYLKDLGYNDEAVKYVQSRIAKSKKKVLD